MRIFVVTCGLGVLFLGGRAEAACHHFTAVAAGGVDEGDKVTVTVKRDSAVADSSVRVMTVDGTARAPGDYSAFDKRVFFTGEQTEKTVTIHTREDGIKEGSETFSVKVSEGQGCPRADFEYDPAAKVTIKDDDGATPKPSTPTPVPTQAPQAVQATASPTPTPTATPTPKPTKKPKPSPTPTETALAVTTEDDDGFPWLPVAAVAGFVAAAGGALILTRMRRGV